MSDTNTSPTTPDNEVRQILDTLVTNAHNHTLNGDSFDFVLREIKAAEIRISQLIVKAEAEALDKYGLNRPMQVGEVVTQYKILERIGRPSKTSHNTRFRVLCLECGSTLVRYKDKLTLKHRYCIKQNGAS